MGTGTGYGTGTAYEGQVDTAGGNIGIAGTVLCWGAEKPGGGADAGAPPKSAACWRKYNAWCACAKAACHSAAPATGGARPSSGGKG
mmetsp:Transcript_118232/g.205367  ORF Transcript_118232/g.205367 Transcript_118232/m.205367 type:complete len:87 (-) Transcript_118232:422-682(-)